MTNFSEASENTNEPDSTGGDGQRDQTWNTSFSTDSVHYAIGEIKGKIESLVSHVRKIETDLRNLLYGGITAVVLIVGVCWFFYEKLDNYISEQSKELTEEISISSQELENDVENLEDDIQELKEQFIRYEERNSASLSRIEQTLGTLITLTGEESGATNTDNPNSTINPLDNPDLAGPDGALPVADKPQREQSPIPLTTEVIPTEYLTQLAYAFMSEPDANARKELTDNIELQRQQILEEVNGDPEKTIPSVLLELEKLNVDFDRLPVDQKTELISLIRNRDREILALAVAKASEQSENDEGVRPKSFENSSVDRDFSAIQAEYDARLKELILSINNQNTEK